MAPAAHEWLNRPEIGEHFELEEFNSKTLYRAVELVGRNRERIIYALQEAVLQLLGHPKTTPMVSKTLAS